MMRRLLNTTSRQFWLYHLSGVGFLYLVSGILHYFIGPREVLEFNIVGTFFWCFGLTFSALLLRDRHHKKSWAELRFPALARQSFLTILAGGMIAAATTLLALPFYIDGLFSYVAKVKPDLTYLSLTTTFFVRDWLSSCFTLSAWYGIYLSITASRRAMAVEIDNLKLQSALKEAQLSNLSNQLNPHFLFNALNNIRFMIHENGENAEKMLVSLSEVLRYSLQSSSQERVALEQEVDIVTKYIDLVKTQFEDKLKFEMTLPSRLSSYSIPPMVLQMLLENAVKHGLEQLPNGGSISMTVSERDGMLLIQVCNDVPEHLRSLEASMGIGLKNIAERLRLTYGPTSGVTTNISQEQFCVDVNFPVNRNFT